MPANRVLTMDARLKVMRKRRGRSLQSKIVQYAGLFDVDIAVIVRGRESGEYEVFQPVRDRNWPPAMADITPRILHPGQPKTDEDICLKELRRLQISAERNKVPKLG
ncbi:hypothetical protein AB5N19_02790 [Seiridium cardinale]|uniref:MADS-box domain-containing protein n=1 Tax=Seiridium cardinale TaxID=138064 RepID=A0ABR2XGU3_9PEZI